MKYIKFNLKICTVLAFISIMRDQECTKVKKEKWPGRFLTAEKQTGCILGNRKMGRVLPSPKNT